MFAKVFSVLFLALLILGCINNPYTESDNNTNNSLNTNEIDSDAVKKAEDLLKKIPVKADITKVEPIDPIIVNVEKIEFPEIFPGTGENPVVTEVGFEGNWRAYSKGIYYDDGDWDFAETPTELMKLFDDNTWSHGSLNGTWETLPIQENDWTKWGIESYGPTRKMFLHGWPNKENPDGADGPIEERGAIVDYFWTIYRTDAPEEKSPAQVQMKFGHAVTKDETETRTDTEIKCGTGNADVKFVGKWRHSSNFTVYDPMNEVTKPSIYSELYLCGDNTWDYDSNKGTWEIQNITEADWKNWDINSYGPTRKLILHGKFLMDGWSVPEESNTSGPIEKTGETLDYLWVIFESISPIDESIIHPQ
ncbi:MAG: hypothetical protein Q7K42_04125, partial [Candidatus Diapherotrites archaeon]|nr:hypothetical protein [Candidatus Diapherotrites archaeon]